MDVEVRLYLGTAAAMEGNSSGYPCGERHALILYVAQNPGAEPDWAKAEEVVSDAHWGAIELTKTGVVSKDKQLEHPFSEMYPYALENGSALLIYSGVEGENT